MSAQPKLLPELCTAEEILWLARMAGANGYIAPAPMGQGRWCAICQFAYTAGILTGRMFDDYGYSDRWCFEDIGAALRALFDWASRDFEGEPQGWHRHPDSGRRRPDGDPTKEYVAI